MIYKMLEEIGVFTPVAETTSLEAFQKVSTKNILISLIRSIDLYNDLLKDHHRRTATVAYHLGNTYGLDRETMKNLILAASLHDIGAIYIAERKELLQSDIEDPSPHEILGEQMLTGFTPFERISRIVRHHHIMYSDVQDGTVPSEEVPIECYFLHLADRIDILAAPEEYAADTMADVAGEIRAKFGSDFAPFLEETFEKVIASRNLYADIRKTTFQQLLFDYIEDDFISLSNDDIRGLALIFSRIVDCKSPWTYSHSVCVGILASHIGRYAGFDDDTCFKLEIAGFLHDIGKIGVPAELLNKAAPLEGDEFDQLQLHVHYTSIILKSLEGFSTIAEWASHHHEKRDKTGYPLHVDWEEDLRQNDILAFSDILTAVVEDRPYRKARTREEIVTILGGLSPEQLDQSVCDLVLGNLDELLGLQRTVQEHIKQYTISKQCFIDNLNRFS